MMYKNLAAITIGGEIFQTETLKSEVRTLIAAANFVTAHAWLEALSPTLARELLLEQTYRLPNTAMDITAAEFAKKHFFANAEFNAFITKLFTTSTIDFDGQKISIGEVCEHIRREVQDQGYLTALMWLKTLPQDAVKPLLFEEKTYTLASETKKLTMAELAIQHPFFDDELRAYIQSMRHYHLV